MAELVVLTLIRNEVDEYEDDMDAINVGEKIHRRPE